MGKRTDSYKASKVCTVIGKGTTFDGTLTTAETVRIEGLVKGNIISEGTLIVGYGGKVEGTIEAVNILIGGEVHGELYASGKIEVNPTGKIYGNLHTKSLIVDDKALFQGTCEMLTDNEKAEEKEDKTAPTETSEEKSE